MPERNDPCPCGSGKKFKKCCLNKLNIHPTFNFQQQPAQTAMQSRPSQQEIGALMSLFNQQRFIEAEQTARLITKNFPHDGFGWKVLGAALKQMGRNADALEPMQRAAVLSPGDVEAFSHLGSILNELGRLDEAKASYRRAIQIKPDFAEAYNNLGLTLNELGQLDEAEVSYRQALQIKPSYAKAYFNLGNTLNKKARLIEAEANYRKALQIKPDFAEAHNNLGNTIRCLGRLGEAETSYRQALHIKPDYVEVYNNLGNTLRDLGRLGEAEISYRQALHIKPDYVEVYNNLGNTLRDLGRLGEAEISYRQALQVKPDYAEVYRNLGHILKDLGRFDEALANYKLSARVKNNWKDALRYLTTPLVLDTGLVLGLPQGDASTSMHCKHATIQQKHSFAPNAPLAASYKLYLPEGGQSEQVIEKKLRIVLIYPPPWQIPSPGESPQGMPFGPPIDRSDRNLDDADFQTITYGLLTIAAQAKRAGHDVSVYNLSTCLWREVATLIAETEADVYGISAFTANRRGMGAVAALIRQHHSQAHITVGGPFVTALPRETLRYYQDIDTAVIGEGEETFMELLECLGSGRPAIDIPGTAWRNEKGVAIGPTRPRIKDLDVLASPFDYFTSFIVMTSRGCPSKCTFCGSFTTWGKMLRFHSAESCLDIFKKALARLPMPFIAIKDDTFTAHRRRTIAICDAIIESKMNFLWSCDTRVDSLDDELLYKMRLAGCQMISLGVESGSLEILKAIRKETTPEMVLEATRSAQKYGMHVRYYMIICNRGETPETIQQSIDLIKAGRPNRYYTCALSFFPGTEDWAILCEKQGLTPDIFFRNDFKELGVATNRHKELDDVMCHVTSDIGAIYGFSYTVEERKAVVGRLPYLHCAHVELANAYFRAGQLGEAESALNRAEELGFPIGNIIHNQRACIAMARGDINSAVSFLEQAVQNYPHYIVMNNLNDLRTWAKTPVNERGKPPVLIDSVQAPDFNSQLQSITTRPTAM